MAFFYAQAGVCTVFFFHEMFRNVLGRGEKDRAGITPFQALCTSLASRVGTGNIAGVAVALYLGGPGAVFWMWVGLFSEWLRLCRVDAGSAVQDPE